MDTFNIQGGKKLRGTIPVMGAKNAAGPIIAATTLIRDSVVLRNVPDISDVSAILDIVESMGASVERNTDHSVVIDATHLDVATINYDLIKKIRFSIFFLGCLARRFGKIQMAIPGGCSIGSRPLDAHFSALRDLGYECTVADQWITVEKKSDPRGSIVMSEFSVTGTETAILASVLCDDSVTIRCAAADHVVQDLCWFLNAAGAEIGGVGTHILSITGVKSLHATEYTIMPDPIETGTFIALAAATRGSIEIQNAAPEFLSLEMRKFEDIGVTCALKDVRRSVHGVYDLATIVPHVQHSIRPIKKLHSMPYPGFTPDLMQPFALLMTQAQGISLIHDWMYDGRLRYVSELQKMGANITVMDPHRVLIVGPTPLYAKEIMSYDLRAGATLVLAGLIAEGETVIRGVEQVDRGYERLEERLQKLGAVIHRTHAAESNENAE